MSTWPKIIRDPVHNLVPFEDTHCDRLLLQLINTREFQRLRRIKQLGFSQLTFPGADHSRFAHSIGVMHISRLMLARVERIRPQAVDEDQRMVVLAAALLHDVGHGPFSHAFESVTKGRHEARTLEIITSDETEINQTLRSVSPDLPDRIGVFFDEDSEEDSVRKVLQSAYLTQIVSSQLDADRFDYLLRDSHATGTETGRFDLAWLLQHLQVDVARERLFLNSKALFAAEAYVFARHHMYRTVYYHKTTRAAEVMLKLMFRRYQELLETAGTADLRARVVPDSPPAVRSAFSGPIPLGDYLRLDDHTMTEFAKACTFCSDVVLRSLATGLLERKLYKAIDVSDAIPHRVANFQERARALASAGSGLPDAYSLAVDTPGDTAYKLYNPDAEKPATQIYVADSSGNPVELSQLSRNVGNLAQKYLLTRYYFPASVRDRLQAEAAPLLLKD